MRVMFRALKRYIVRHERLNGMAVKVRDFLFDVREKDKSFGSLNPDKKFYVIRGNTRNFGLLAVYFRTLEKIYYSIINGFIPVVDFENYKAAYNVNFPVNGTRNMWEYYFEQPSRYSLSEVYRSMNVRLSAGISHNPPVPKGITAYGKMAFAPVKKYITDIARDYFGKDFILQKNKTDNKYQLGLDYLVRMICISECKYLIASVTHGLEFARALNQGRYQEEYIFRLGRY